MESLPLQRGDGTEEKHRRRLCVGFCYAFKAGTGNATTANRLIANLSDVFGVVRIANLQDATLQQQSLDALVALHALHFHDTIMSMSPHLPIVVIMGGTDANCCLHDAEKKEKIGDVLTRAAAIVCFNECLVDKLQVAFPGAYDQKIAIIPQAVCVEDEDEEKVEEEEKKEEEAGEGAMPRVAADAVSDEKEDDKCVLVPREGMSWKQTLGVAEDDVLLLLPASLRAVKDPSFLLSVFQQHWQQQQQQREREEATSSSLRKNVYLLLVGPVLDEDFVAHEPLLLDLVARFYETKRSKKRRQQQHQQQQQVDETLFGWKNGCAFIGNLSRPLLLKLMKESSAVLNTSTSEGMSGALLEAMALGVLVLARNIEGNRSLVVESGTFGLLFDSPQECLDVAAKMAFEAGEERSSSFTSSLVEMASRAKLHVAEKHSLKVEMEAYIRVIDKAFSTSA